MCLSSKQSSLFSFYALPSGGKLKDAVVHSMRSRDRQMATAAIWTCYIDCRRPRHLYLHCFGFSDQKSLSPPPRLLVCYLLKDYRWVILSRNIIFKFRCFQLLLRLRILCFFSVLLKLGLNGPTTASFCFFLVFSIKPYTILQQIDVKNVKPESGSAIQTPNLVIISLLP